MNAADPRMGIYSRQCGCIQVHSVDEKYHWSWTCNIVTPTAAGPKLRPVGLKPHVYQISDLTLYGYGAEQVSRSITKAFDTLTLLPVTLFTLLM
jgi:hypothetical protein